MNNQSTKKIASAWDFESEVQGIDAELTDVVNALQLLYENLESEGYQPADKIVEWQAVNFVRRFDYYLSTLFLIKTTLQGCQKQLGAAIEKTVKERKHEN